MNWIKINPSYDQIFFDQIFFQKSPIRVMWKADSLLYNRENEFLIDCGCFLIIEITENFRKIYSKFILTGNRQREEGHE